MTHIYTFLLMFAVVTSGEKLSGAAACEEASSVLEMVMFFPMSMCGGGDTETPGSENTWFSSLTVYSDTLIQVLYSAKSMILHTVDRAGTKGFGVYLEHMSNVGKYTREKMTSYMVNYFTFMAEKGRSVTEQFKQIINSAKEMISECTTKIGRASGRVVNSVIPFVSKASTFWRVIGASLFGLCDMTMTFKACVMTVLDECFTSFTYSASLYVRYALAGILLLSLPFSIYNLVKEKQESIPKRRVSEKLHRKGDKISKSKLNQETSSWTNLLNLGQISYFTGYIFSSNEAHNDEEQDRILRMLHYSMCEIYDGCDCNCGGRISPISGMRNDHVTRFKLKPAHYAMCEYFDKMACNCGGFLRKSPVPVQISRRYYSDVDTDTTDTRNNAVDKEQQAVVHTPSADEKIVLEMSIKDGEHCVEKYEIADQDHNSTSMFTEVSMMDEIENIEKEIGHPQFNSSFIEDSPYASTLSDSAYSDRASGDGPMLVITRRSPRKECGISFTEDESVSYLEDSATDEDDSLLDVSDINKSLSFNSGDGVYEFVILCALQTIFRTAKRIFQTARPKQLDNSQTSIGDLSQDTYFVISRRKSRSRHGKQSLNKNHSAMTKDTDTSVRDDSLTDYDRASDLSEFFGVTSYQGVSNELGSWSLSSSNDSSGSLHSRDELRTNEVFDNQIIEKDLVINNCAFDLHTESGVVTTGKDASRNDSNGNKLIAGLTP